MDKENFDAALLVQARFDYLWRSGQGGRTAHWCRCGRKSVYFSSI